MKQFDGISGGNFTLPDHGQVKSSPPARYHLLADIGTTEFGSKLLTRQSRLGHPQDRRSEGKLVPNIHKMFIYTFRGNVLPQHSPWYLQPRVCFLPETVMFRGIRVNRFVHATMNGVLRLPIALEVHLSHADFTEGRSVEDTCHDFVIVVLEFARQTHVHR